MPTENRSSNTEMVSILRPCPFCGGKADSRCTDGPDPDWFVECTECLASAPVFNEDKLDGWNMRAQPAPQPHPEPIAWMVGTAIWWTKEEAERDAAATGLPVTPVGTITESSKPAEQHQGEPVGEVVAFGEGLHEIAWSAGRMPKLGAKLYTSADHGEVERLRSIERSYGLREALLEQMKGERDRMIARTLELADQLANQDALLHKLKETLQREYWDEYAGLDETRELIDAALAASAETEATS
ncbi:hypothetical protein D3C76_1169990 [compost metagenome]